MPVPIITNPMKLRQKLSESASPGPTPSYFGAGRALQRVANDKLVQHWLNSAEVGVSFLRYNRNGQVEKLVRITAGQQLNSGQQQSWCSTYWWGGEHIGVLHWWRGRMALLLPWEETELGGGGTIHSVLAAIGKRRRGGLAKPCQYQPTTVPRPVPLCDV